MWAHGHFVTIGSGVRGREACVQVRSLVDWTDRWPGLRIAFLLQCFSCNRPFPNSLPTPTFILILDGSSATGAAKPTWGGEIRKFPAMNSLRFFPLDCSFWQGQRATVAWGFKCAFLDCSKETPDLGAKSTETDVGGNRSPRVPIPHTLSSSAPGAPPGTTCLVRQRVAERHIHAPSAMPIPLLPFSLPLHLPLPFPSSLIFPCVFHLDRDLADPQGSRALKS